MKTKLSFLILGIIVGIILFLDPFHMHSIDEWLRGSSSVTFEKDAKETQLWTCGMHPDVIQDHPGTCPICQMDLVPLQHAAVSSEPVSQESKILYTCPMHPDILQEEPGECPVCGMDLVPARKPDSVPKPQDSDSGKVLFYRNPMDPSITSPVPQKDEMGMDYVPVYEGEADRTGSSGATVTIDPAVVQTMNVRTDTVQRMDLTHSIRTVGYLDFDQERMTTVTPKYEGWVERVYVNYPGQSVKKGDPLFDIYSPSLVQTQQELLSAKAYAEGLSGASQETRRRAESLLDATRERLRYWDIQEDQVREIEESGSILRTLTVTAPVSGLVMKRMDSLAGMAVRPGMELFHIADLSTLWLNVEIYEEQLPWLDIGSTADVSLPYLPGKTHTGRIRYIEPAVKEKTRTLTVTLELQNRSGDLRSGMYATVTFKPVAARNVLTIPTQSVLRTGEKDVVIVDLGEGRYAPRTVTLGRAGEDRTEILQGLKEGERIVTSSQFLIDSESNLREAVKKMVEKLTGSSGPLS